MPIALASCSSRLAAVPEAHCTSRPGRQLRRASARRPAAPAAAAAPTAVAAAAAMPLQQAPPPPADSNQHAREGSYEAPLVQAQSSKPDAEQAPLATALPSADLTAVADVAVVGCGPAGLALAAELAKQGLSVVLVGRESKFVNNYGVWLDEFKALGMEHTLEKAWEDAVCYFREGREVRVGRAYGRVCRRKLRAHLVEQAAAAGVRFLEGEVVAISHPEPSTSGSSSGSGSPQQQQQQQVTGAGTRLEVAGGGVVSCRLATLASGAAAGRFLSYEDGAPPVAAQTAYGIEAEVEGYAGTYDLNTMLFMDYRRHHTGLYEGTATRQRPGEHQNGGEGLWGAEREAPSFLYAMPLGGNRVFLEETCLVARPALPFAVLKRRLERRCAALGLKLKEIHEEEWSYIPVGGPLPLPTQPITAFGAAANLIHPATGYSLARSLREAPAMAAAISSALGEHPADGGAAARAVWEALWTPEKRRQASFHVFGMELLAQLGVSPTADFFTTFFRLPATYWRGFLASQLSSVDLLSFAMLTFVLAPLGIKAKLVTHLITDPAGRYLVGAYTGKNTAQWQEGDCADGGGSANGSKAAGAAVSAAVALAVLQQLAQRV